MQKHVYAIGSEGIPVLIERGYATQDFTEKFKHTGRTDGQTDET
jgi:hypothetical protein